MSSRNNHFSDSWCAARNHTTFQFQMKLLFYLNELNRNLNILQFFCRCESKLMQLFHLNCDVGMILYKVRLDGAPKMADDDDRMLC